MSGAGFIALAIATNNFGYGGFRPREERPYPGGAPLTGRLPVDQHYGKLKMADNILTPEFRGAFVQVFKATGMKGQPDSAKKYSVRAAFLPGADLTEMKKQAGIAASEKWGNAIPKTMRSPFRKNEELDTPVAGIPDDAIVMTFSASEDRRPGVVDAKLQDIIDDAECYSGAWYRAQVRAFAYDTSGNKGVSFGLQNLQKLREGEPLGGRLPASKAFTAVESPAGSADALFD